MDSDRIDAYCKGHDYATEADKHIWIIDGQNIRFSGNHAEHQLKRVNDCWVCDCAFFARRRVADPVVFQVIAFCPHTIAVDLVARATAQMATAISA